MSFRQDDSDHLCERATCEVCGKLETDNGIVPLMPY